jgi:hypothetical protein
MVRPNSWICVGLTGPNDKQALAAARWAAKVAEGAGWFGGLNPSRGVERDFASTCVNCCVSVKGCALPVMAASQLNSVKAEWVAWEVLFILGSGHGGHASTSSRSEAVIIGSSDSSPSNPTGSC